MQSGRWSFLRTVVFTTALLKLHPATAIAQGPRQEYRQLHLGVEVRLVIAAPDKPAADSAARSAYVTIAALEQLLSDWRPTSEVRRLAEHPGAWVTVSAPLFEVMEAALTVANASDGAFDPTIGPLVMLWREARTTGQPPTDSAVASARTRIGWRHVELDSARRAVKLARAAMRIDFGGIAKGYILDSARRVLRSHGFASVLLEAGGDIVLGDAPPGEPGWRVAVASTAGEQTLTLANVCIGTSGPASQYVDLAGVSYSHVIDARTGVPLTHRTQATVLHHNGAMSDALSTLVTILSHERGVVLAQQLGAVAVFVRDSAPR